MFAFLDYDMCVTRKSYGAPGLVVHSLEIKRTRAVFIVIVLALSGAQSALSTRLGMMTQGLLLAQEPWNMV